MNTGKSLKHLSQKIEINSNSLEIKNQGADNKTASNLSNLNKTSDNSNKVFDNDLLKFMQLLEALRLMKSFKDTPYKLEVRKNLSYKTFLDKYLSENRPVVLKEMINDWPALQKWSPAYLKENYGSVEIEVMFGRKNESDYEKNRDKLRTKVKVKDFIDLILTDGNNCYLTANNEALRKTPLKSLLNEIKFIPKYIDLDSQGAIKLWVGGKGTITPLHHDNTNILLVQVYGEKLVKLIPSTQQHLVYPDGYYSLIDFKNMNFEKYPLLKKATILEVILKPGDILFIPIFWWHYVESTTSSISLSFLNISQNIVVKGSEILLINSNERK